ncbi:MAG: hypothetical protein WBF33_37760 [Candidatus Nitrosopolaris sp.]
MYHRIIEKIRVSVSSNNKTLRDNMKRDARRKDSNEVERISN